MSESAPDRSYLRQQDVITVHRDGEDVEVYNWVSLERTQRAVLRGDLTSENYDEDPTVMDGEGVLVPEAVTQWVADDLAREYNVDVTECGIDVIDVESDEVDVL